MSRKTVTRDGEWSPGPVTGVDRLRAGPPLGLKLVCVLTALGTLAVVDYPLELLSDRGLRHVVGTGLLLVFSTAPVIIYGLWQTMPWAWRTAAVYYWVVAVAALDGELLVIFLVLGLLGYLHRLRDHFRPDADPHLTEYPSSES